jgi:hypothetical protein
VHVRLHTSEVLAGLVLQVEEETQIAAGVVLCLSVGHEPGQEGAEGRGSQSHKGNTIYIQMPNALSTTDPLLSKYYI